MPPSRTTPPMVPAPGPAPTCDCCGETLDWNGCEWVCLTKLRRYLNRRPFLSRVSETVPNYFKTAATGTRTIPAHTREME